MKEIVRVIPEKKYPFKIIGHNLSPGNNIRYELEQVEHPEGAEYVLTVENLRELTGHYNHTISLKTDSNIQPSLKIHVEGYIQDHQP